MTTDIKLFELKRIPRMRFLEKPAGVEKSLHGLIERNLEVMSCAGVASGRASPEGTRPCHPHEEADTWKTPACLLWGRPALPRGDLDPTDPETWGQTER